MFWPQAQTEPRTCAHEKINLRHFLTCTYFSWRPGSVGNHMTFQLNPSTVGITPLILLMQQREIQFIFSPCNIIRGGRLFWSPLQYSIDYRSSIVLGYIFDPPGPSGFPNLSPMAQNMAQCRIPGPTLNDTPEPLLALLESTYVEHYAPREC